jgi:hypothetical protein
VRQTAHQALAEALAAGNPTTYVTEIDGSASGSRRSGFRAGAIEQATRSVRIQFVGKPLADVANAMKPILEKVIAETFPFSKTKALQREWSWWVQKDRYATGKNTSSVRLGARVPDTITIYDVLWLVPDVWPAQYAWFANRNAVRSSGYKYNLVKSRRMAGTAAGVKLRRRLRGYLAEATRRMRGKRNPGITVQGWFVRQAMTGPSSRSRHGVPAIRVAYKSGLMRPVDV